MAEYQEIKGAGWRLEVGGMTVTVTRVLDDVEPGVPVPAEPHPLPLDWPVKVRVRIETADGGAFRYADSFKAGLEMGERAAEEMAGLSAHVGMVESEMRYWRDRAKNAEAIVEENIRGMELILANAKFAKAMQEPHSPGRQEGRSVAQAHAVVLPSRNLDHHGEGGRDMTIARAWSRGPP